MDYFSLFLDILTLTGQGVMHIFFASRLTGKQKKLWHFAVYCLALFAIQFVPVHFDLNGILANGMGMLALFAVSRFALGNQRPISCLAAVLAFYISQFSYGILNSLESIIFPELIGNPMLYLLLFVAQILFFALCTCCYRAVCKFLDWTEDSQTPNIGLILFPTLFFFAAEMYILQSAYGLYFPSISFEELRNHGVLLALQVMGLVALLCTLYAYRHLCQGFQAQAALQSLTQAAHEQKVYIMEPSQVLIRDDSDSMLDDTCELEIVFDNIKEIPVIAEKLAGVRPLGDGEFYEGEPIIRIEYYCELTNDAVVGYGGNPNTAHLEFSNNPYDETSMGKTPEDKVTAFTFGVHINKLGGDKMPLSGAEFSLYEQEYDGYWVDGDWDDEMGEYGYWDDETGEWIACEEYWVDEMWREPVVVSPIAGSDNTQFEICNLDAGKYKLVETRVPDGYQKADDIIFEIVADAEEVSDDPKLTKLDIIDKDGNSMMQGEGAVFSLDPETGVITTNVVNYAGVKLPSTGGAAEERYQSILDDYSERLRTAVPGLVEEYKSEAAGNTSGLEGLAKLSNDKVEELAAICNEGGEEMAKVMYTAGSGSYDEYEAWAGKLYDVYEEEAARIMDAYMDSAM